MADVSQNCITKWAIMIVSVIIAVLMIARLVRLLTDDRDFTTDKIIDVILVVVSIVLAGLSFWGAFTENACLLYIALVWCIIRLIYAIWALVQCFTSDNNPCEALDYVVKVALIVLYIVLIICTWTFIQSIKGN